MVLQQNFANLDEWLFMDDYIKILCRFVYGPYKNLSDLIGLNRATPERSESSAVAFIQRTPVGRSTGASRYRRNVL